MLTRPFDNLILITLCKAQNPPEECQRPYCGTISWSGKSETSLRYHCSSIVLRVCIQHIFFIFTLFYANFLICAIGSCAGIMEHLVFYPVDTLKVSIDGVIILHSLFKKFDMILFLQTHLQASGRNLSVSQTARILYKDEGLLRFWKGANVVVSGCIPAHGAQFCLYEYLREYLAYRNDEFNLLSTLSIGALTTFAHDFFIAPSDVIK